MNTLLSGLNYIQQGRCEMNGKHVWRLVERIWIPETYGKYRYVFYCVHCTRVVERDDV